MAKISITMELIVGAGKKPSRRPSKEESLLLNLLSDGTRTVRELVEGLTFEAKIPEGLARQIIRGAVSAGILQALF